MDGERQQLTALCAAAAEDAGAARAERERLRASEAGRLEADARAASAEACAAAATAREAEARQQLAQALRELGALAHAPPMDQEGIWASSAAADSLQLRALRAEARLQQVGVPQCMRVGALLAAWALLWGQGCI